MTLAMLVRQLEQQIPWAPAWSLSVLMLVAALVLALLLHEGIVRVVRRGLRFRDIFWRSLLVRTRGPGRLALVVVALSLATEAAPLTSRQSAIVQHALLIAFIVLVGWSVLRALDIAAALYMRRYSTDAADNLTARKHLTQVRILRRAMATLAVVLTTGVALMTIPGVRQVGVSLLAAGGAAGIILGLALQPLLSNLIAGVQIALTQPIRIDDAVIVEGEWGNIEEINATYVVVRLWDLRRLILPLKYFLEHPFQNWTRESSDLLGSVMLYVDYSLPVTPVRAKLAQILEATPLWDRRVGVVQVTDARERTVELRLLVSARSGPMLFDLRCLVREQMVGFLQAEHPTALPRDRLELARGSQRSASTEARADSPRVQ